MGIQVQLGEVYMDRVTSQKTIYPNKTRKFLLPCIKEYGEQFTHRMSNVFKIAVGIGDIIVEDCGWKHEKHLFILIDTTVAKFHFQDFIKWIKEQPMYEDDYVYNNIQKSKYHMVVLQLPERFWESLEQFKSGQYSKMYDPVIIETFFNRFPDIQKILIKDRNYRFNFTAKLNHRFGSSIKPEEYDGELDFPPELSKEVFNYKLKS